MPDAPDKSPDHYKALHVDSEADTIVIQAAYRRLAQQFHPDRAPGPEAMVRMIEINAAWEVLRSPAKRAAYDVERGLKPAASVDAAAEARPAWRPGSRVRTEPRSAQPPPWQEPRPPSTNGTGSSPSSAGRPPAEGRTARGWDGPTSPNAGPGRSTVGGGYDPATMGAAGSGAAGSPPGNPSGSVMSFGRYAGWSLGEIGRSDAEYLEWLEGVPIGRMYRDEIDGLLRRMGRRRAGPDRSNDRRGLRRG